MIACIADIAHLKPNYCSQHLKRRLATYNFRIGQLLETDTYNVDSDSTSCTRKRIYLWDLAMVPGLVQAT